MTIMTIMTIMMIIIHDEKVMINVTVPVIVMVMVMVVVVVMVMVVVIKIDFKVAFSNFKLWEAFGFLPTVAASAFGGGSNYFFLTNTSFCFWISLVYRYIFSFFGFFFFSDSIGDTSFLTFLGEFLYKELNLMFLVNFTENIREI